MANSEDALLARQYVLGRLSAEEREQVERRFLFDAEFEDVVLMEEADLLDGFSAGSLDPDEERALRHWAREHEHARHRLELAAAFHHVTESGILAPVSGKDTERTRGFFSLRPRAARSPRFWSLSVAGLSSVCCVLTVASLWLLSANRSLKERLQTMQSSQVPAHLAPSPRGASSFESSESAASHTVVPRASRVEQADASGKGIPKSPSAPHAESVLTVLLVAEEGRGSAGIPQIVLRSGMEIVDLQFIAQSELPEGHYNVAIIGPDGGPLQKTDRLRSQRVHQHNLVTLRLSSKAMKPGIYRVQLTQQPRAEGSSTFEYGFEIRKL